MGVKRGEKLAVSGSAAGGMRYRDDKRIEGLPPFNNGADVGRSLSEFRDQDDAVRG